MISIKNLSKAFGTKKVLHYISFSLEKGKVYGIVGENGAGKTTLFNCIVGLDSHQGEVNAQISPLKNHTGFLQTEPFFYSKITGREYLQLFCNARGIALGKDVDFNIFNLPLADYVGSYSTGMKKKLALIAILLQKNDFYILDEPFNGVDIESNFIISEIIARLKHNCKTVLISSHIFSTLSDTCDEILVLKEGRIARTVQREDFSKLDSELKSFTVDGLLDRCDFL